MCGACSGATSTQSTTGAQSAQNDNGNIEDIFKKLLASTQNDEMSPSAKPDPMADFMKKMMQSA